jgi:hypothetical protein
MPVQIANKMGLKKRILQSSLYIGVEDMILG